MLANVSAQIIGAFEDAGLCAREKYGAQDISQISAPVVVVGISQAKVEAAGLGHYLGTRVHENLMQTELYGLKCELVVSLDIYMSARLSGCHGICAGIFDEALAVLSEMKGLGISQVCLEEGAVEKGLYRCPCKIYADAFIVAENEDDGAEFTDFILRGALRNER